MRLGEPLLVDKTSF